MDVIIEASKESVLLSSLSKSLVSDLSYRIPKNYPLLSVQLLSITGNPSGAITTPAGKEVLFNLPKYGMLQGLEIETALVSSGTNGTMITGGSSGQHCPDVGLNVFSLLELRSNNRVIASNSDAYLKVRTYADKFGPGVGTIYRAKAFSATDKTTLATVFTTADTVVTYTPFRCAFFEDPRNFLDLNFCEPLQLRCVYNSTNNMGLTAALTSAQSTLWMKYYNMEAQAQADLRARNFSPQRPLTMLTYDTYVETGTLADDATSTTINLKCNNTVFATHIFLKKNDGSAAAPLLCKDVTVKLGGKTHFNVVPTHVMNVEKDHYGGAGVVELYGNSTTGYPTLTTRVIHPITIYWGLEPNERRYNSGAVALNNLNNPQVIISHADPGTTHDYYVVHEYWTLTSINPADGRIDVSASL